MGAHEDSRAGLLARFGERDVLSKDELYDRFWADRRLDQTEVFGLFDLIEEAYDIPAGILWPEDSIELLTNRVPEKHWWRGPIHDVIAGSGPEALARFKALNSNGHRPALVIADLGLPGMDGRTLCKKIMAINPRVAVLLTSGHAIPLDDTNTRTTDGLPFIPKPFNPPTILLERINALLR